MAKTPPMGTTSRKRVDPGRAVELLAHVREVPRRAGRWSFGIGVRGRRALQRRGYVKGLLSVVVPVYNVEAYLDECLRSLREQTYRFMEIIVVDDGSPDASIQIAKRHLRRDPRIRIVTRPNGGLSAARNTGIADAMGEFLTFLDSDDVVAPTAYEDAIAALHESGSDFAVTNYDRLVDATRHVPALSWIQEAHAVRRLGCRLEQFPEIMVNALAWSKVYRREFWDAAGLTFPVGVLYEDQPVSAEAFSKAHTFDVLPDVAVSWRVRQDRSSISQGSSTTDNLRAQIEATASSLAALRAGGHEAAAQARAVQLLANNMPFFARHLLHGDPEFWRLLRTEVGQLMERIPRADYIARVDAEDKVLYEFIAQDRFDDARLFLEENGLDIERFRTVRADTTVRLELPLVENVGTDCLVLADRQLDIDSRVMRAFWSDAGVLQLEGMALIRNLDLAESPPTVRLALVGTDGQRVALDVEQRQDPRADTVFQHRYCDYRAGGFGAVLDSRDLPAVDATWTFEVTVEAGGLTRCGSLDDVSRAGSAAVAHTCVFTDGVAHILEPDDTGRLTLRVTAAPVYATGAAVDGEASLSLDLSSSGGTDLDITEVYLATMRAPERRLSRVAPTQDSTAQEGGWHARLPLPDPATRRPHLERSAWQVWAETSDGATAPVLAPPGLPDLPGDPGDPSAPTPTRGRHGEVEVVAGVCVATSYRFTDDELAVELRGLVIADDLTPMLTSGDHRVTGELERGEDGAATVRLPLKRTVWGRPGLSLPRGKYRLTLLDPASDRRVTPTPSSELLDTLPADQLLPSARVLVEVFAGNLPALAFHIRPPLAEDERGSRNQTRLRTQARVERADRDSVFFRALYGEVVNCNGLGVHQELVRRRSPLTLYWSVVDRSVPVPPGGTAVIEGSREWHDAIARSRYHMVNVHQLPWFTKPAGQVMIQTMHGYPYKVMGHEWWDKRRFPAAQVRNFDRRAREWDYFVSPATYATPLLIDAFLAPAESTAKVLEIGYPRNDVLQSAEGERLREWTRQELGIAADKTVVLYAPTFRDYLSADDMRAGRVDFVDFDWLSRQLGNRYVFLVRGHAFNARVKGRLASSASVIDVTDYPDINDLILASDAAVLDYSSIRFDYALTDKPMLFFIPDLQQYDDARGGILPYRPTAPGPHVTTRRQLAGLLRDLGRVTRDFAQARAEFRAAYVDLDDGHASERLVDVAFAEADRGRH